MSDPRPSFVFPNRTSNIPFVCLLLQLPCQLHRALRWANFYAASFQEKVCLFVEQLLHQQLTFDETIYNPSHTVSRYIISNQHSFIVMEANVDRLAFQNMKCPHFSALFAVPGDTPCSAWSAVPGDRDEFKLIYENSQDGVCTTEFLNLPQFTNLLFNDWLKLKVNVF
jgi:hypothetical protein